jgi:glucose-6-phosphate isomerase
MVFTQDIWHTHTDPQALLQTLSRMNPLFKKLQNAAHQEAAPLLAIAQKTDDLAEIQAHAETIRNQFARVVVVGAGGSSLSGKTLTMLKPANDAPQFLYLDTIDPDIMEALLSKPLGDTAFIVISKSGTTLETLAQLYVLAAAVKQQDGSEALARQFTVITSKGEHAMRRFAKDSGMKILDHEDGIGGRFAILTNVGLLPAAIAGLDTRALRSGAAAVVSELEKQKTADHFAPAIGAAVQYLALASGKTLSVMLPYSHRLAGFSAWYRQCWAESLGKDGKGSTPIRSVGTTDQHSQLQLYLDGPKDKFFNLILLERKNSGALIDAAHTAMPEYMHGKTIGDIMSAQQEATLATLIARGCPVRVFRAQMLDEQAMGRLLMHFTLEIIFMAELLSINAFDQPAVEDGKKRAHAELLGGVA